MKPVISVTKKGCGDEVNKVLSYAYEVSNKDDKFVKLLISENGTVDIDRVGVTGDIGYCQVSPYWHPEITRDPRFLTDWKWQIEQCHKLYSEGTIFYGLKKYENNAKFRKQVDSLLIFS